MASAAAIVRPLNCILSAAAVLLGALVALGPDLFSQDPWTLGAAALVAALVAGGGNVLNDLFDADTDRVNHPERPIPSGALENDSAIRLSIVLLVAGPSLAFLMLPFAAGAIALIAVLCLVAYETALKRRGLAGNVTISLLVGLLFLFGGAAVGDPAPTAALAAMAFMATLARELVKDVQDMEGDVDRETFPKTAGKGAALGAASASVVAAVLLSPTPVYPLGIFTAVPYIPLVLVADAVLLFAAWRSAEDPAAGASTFKYGMALALVAFLAGAVW